MRRLRAGSVTGRCCSDSYGEIDPSFIVTHHLPLDEAPRGYELFENKDDDCLKVVLKP